MSHFVDEKVLGGESVCIVFRFVFRILIYGIREVKIWLYLLGLLIL